MSDKQTGRLYRSRGSNYAEAIPALADSNVNSWAADEPTKQKQKQKQKVRRERSGGLNAAVGFLFVLAGTLFFGLVDAALNAKLGLITNVGFVLVSVAVALRLSRNSAWAGWTSPPISFFILILIYSALFSKTGGGFIVRTGLDLLLNLSEHLWVILGVTIATGVLSWRSRRTLN